MAGASHSRVNRRPSPRVDVCVIGGGPAGALVSHSLAKRGHDVVILEAGERFDPSGRRQRMEEFLRPSHPFHEVWNMGGDRDAYSSSGEVTYPLNSRRVKGIGGSSLHWGGRLGRLKRKDFEMRSRYGVASDWPISYEDLRPYYARAEAELGASGPPQLPFGPPREREPPMEAFPPSYSDTLFADACEELGITVHPVMHAINSEPYDGRSACEGYGTCSPVCPSGAKYSADVHVDNAEEHGARVIDRAAVQKLHHDSTAERVTAAEYVTPEGTSHRQEAREFVVAAGGVETPRLLLLSRSERYPDGLANSSGLVGHYFEERPVAVVRARVDRPTRQHLIGFGTTESHEFYTPDEVPSGSIKIEFDNTAGPRPVDLALGSGPTAAEFRDALRNPTDLDVWSDLAADRSGPLGDELLDEIRTAYGGHLQLSAAIGDLPRKRNRVTLDSAVTDHLGNPVPDVSWSKSDYARATMQQAFSILHDILDDVDATVRSRTQTEFWEGIGHHLGTTRMGEDPSDSVVTPSLRTHDLGNLSIVSSSVFVTGGAMQPTLTIAALALRLADRLHAEL